jgi:hypothetical protein
MSDDGWGDLFAMAAGDANDTSSQEVKKEAIVVTSDKKTKKGPKKRKRGRDDDAPRKDEFQHMLQSRMHCQGDTEPDINNATEWHLKAYAALKAVRMASFSNAAGETKNGLDKCLVSQLSKLLPFPSHLDRGEAEILRQKQQTVMECMSKRDMSFKSSIRRMIACDDLYLRLYYLQVSGAFLSSPYLPHPVTYFENTKVQAIPQETTTRDPKIESYFDLGQIGSQHPLSKIYRQRQLESRHLFQSHDESGRATLKELNRPTVHAASTLEFHDTPATLIFQECRDSCRDVLCHLYCYATLSPSNISSLVKKLKHLGATDAIELGAGTGYMAKLLKEAGLETRAYDIDPPSDHLNDYHGRTHSFVEVKKGTHESVLRASTLADSTALLMCYPPPQCSMAYDALKAFQKAGGKYLIHIGEWKGLTGSKEFEELLLKDFRCVHRVPCSSWGTDASDVTIWERGSGKASLLLPCISCGEFEATRRCRLLRHAVYCDRACFQQHKGFEDLCRLAIVPLLDLEFENELHFQPLVVANAKSKKKRKQHVD